MRGSKLLFVLVLASAGTARAADGGFDCRAGCPLAVGKRGAICGNNGVTYANPCLAACSGATIAYGGACAPPMLVRGAAPGAPTNGSQGGSAPPSSYAGGAAPLPLSLNPVGQFLDPTPEQDDGSGGGGGGSSGAAAVATGADMRRFLSEGLYLVGPAMLGQFNVTKPDQDPDGGAYKASKRMNRLMEIFTVRVIPSRGLVYSSRPKVATSRQIEHSVPGSARTSLWLDGSAPQQQGGGGSEPAAADGNAGEEDSDAEAEAAASATAAAAAAAAAAADSQGGAAAPAIRASEWIEIQDVNASTPYAAIGWLNFQFENSQWPKACTGSLIGDYVVLTAAHCVYDKQTRAAAISLQFTPAHHYNRALRKRVTPFGSADAYGYDYLAGRRADNTLKPWTSDMAVVLLKEPLGRKAGTLGISFSKAGYSGEVHAAGYPTQTVPWGTYVHNAGTCIIHDSNGSNRKLRFKSATKSTCPTGCPVAENGQSGQPMFSADGAGWLVHGVLSWGPPVSATGCTNGADTYTEIDALHFKYLNTTRLWKPPSANR